MAPTGLAILLGAGPVVGHGIARALASPEQGNLAIALISRRQEKLTDLVNLLKTQCPGAVAEGFVSDTNPDNLSNAFSQIASHPSFHNLPLRAAIFNPKCPSRVPYLEETFSHFNGHLTEYVGGAFAFSQLAVQRLLGDHASEPATLAEGSPKKGTIIFTGVTGALKCNANFAAYGAARAGVRQLSQSMARELSEKGIHVVHTIANGPIAPAVGPGEAESEEVKSGKRISAESVGRVYLELVRQGPDLWTQELDLRPAQEKF
ncbi:NAD(P)-binding protein [Hortaea werneckii]|uniref:NAD(P)-binding protein n=1 Tax=Hortaea werneckii TaxID=91943 RepID=A0A3M6WWT1_HORWE|nr:NAD(P)-binding protein [Hortaea werneckii]KAI7577713.1 NAD(P)-binding protein [Hortaea werneckii]RMX83073.1 hypothetical protein D0868_15718 [Hortaea werneckii]